MSMNQLDMTKLQSEEDFAGLDARDALRFHVPGAAEAVDLPYLKDWKPPGPVADAFFWSDAGIIGIRGPVGSGKTQTHLKSRLRRALMMPRSNIELMPALSGEMVGVRHYKVVIARATYRQLWQTTIPSWWECFPKHMGTWSGGRGDPVTHRIEFDPGDGSIVFVCEFLAFGQSPGEIEANMRGVQTTDLGLEEADTCDPSVVSIGSGRVKRYPALEHFKETDQFEAYSDEEASYGQISCSYNAPDEDNWTVRLLEGGEGDASTTAMMEEFRAQGVSIDFFRQPGFGEDGAENLQNLRSGYYELQRAIMTAEGRSNDIERLIENRVGFVRLGDPVFLKHFDKSHHIAKGPLEPVKGHPIRIGLDQGYFGAAVITQFFDPFQWRFLAELCFEEGSFAPQFGAALRDLLDERFFGLRIEGAYCDIAGSSRESLENVTWTNEVSQAARIEIEPQPLGGNRIAPRLAVWRAALDYNVMGQQGFLADRSCRLLRRGLANDYVWAQDPDKAANAGRVPKKRGVRASDVIDAGGYVMLSESLPDGRPKTATLIGHNGGPAMDGDEWFGAPPPKAESYSIDPMEGLF